MPDPTFTYESLPGVEDVSQAEIEAYLDSTEKDVLPKITAIQQAKAQARASILPAALFPWR